MGKKDDISISTTSLNGFTDKNPFDEDSISGMIGQSDRFEQMDDVQLDIESIKTKNISDDLYRKNVDKQAELLFQREEKLKQREEMVLMKEKELERQETKPEAVKKNWPSRFLLLDRHDIEIDIPVEHQRLCKRAYRMWMMTTFVLTWNLITLILVMKLTTGVVSQPFERVLYGAIYLCLGVAGSWLGWYKGLYEALSDSKRLAWLRFWVFFGLHFIFLVYSIVGLPNWATSGVFNLLAQLGAGGSWVVFVFCVVNITVLCFISLLSLVILRSVRSVYKSSGASDRIREDTRRSVLDTIAQKL